MNKNLQTIYKYHNQTKHTPLKYANSLGYMDWETQPSPYRSYDNTKKLKLKISFDNSTPNYHEYLIIRI